MDDFALLPQPFSRHEALSLGFTSASLSRATSAGTLQRLGRGVYAVRSPWSAHEPWQRHQFLSLAAARLTPDAILSHASAAAAMGLPHPAYPPERVSMTLLDDARTSRPDDWRRFHRGATPHRHIELDGGRPRLTPTRTVVDCARVLLPRDALAIADGALRAGLVTHDGLLAMRRHQRRWPGVASMTGILLLADGRRENWLESASAWALAAWGVPAPVPQVEVLAPDGEFLARVDALWPELGVVGEADGVGKYLIQGTTEQAVSGAVAAEVSREKRLLHHGLAVIRWTPAEAVSGEALHGRLQPYLTRPPLRHSAVFRCGCCRAPLAECAIDRRLRRWRILVRKEFERSVW